MGGGLAVHRSRDDAPPGVLVQHALRMATRTAAAASPSPSAAPEVPWQNRVVLCGRLTGPVAPVDLPSGDPLWRFRVTVERPADPSATRADGTPRRIVDAVDCATAAAKLAGRLERLGVGSVLEVEGVLTRRFWRSAGGPASRYEVVVDRVKVVRRIAAAAASGA